jgi:ParB-like chromosome segregation protein Spo0J
MPGPRDLHLVTGQLAPLDDLEAALLAVVRGEVRGATVQRVAELLDDRPLTEHGAGLPGALSERRLRALDEEERVDRTAVLALWALAQPLAQVVQAQVASRAGTEVVWAEAVLRWLGTTAAR